MLDLMRKAGKLNRWSRARAIRPGRKLDRLVLFSNYQLKLGILIIRLWVIYDNTDGTEFQTSSPLKECGSSGRFVMDVAAGGPIYMVSYGTGRTAEHLVNAALGQFDYCLVDRVCPVNTHLFSGSCEEEKYPSGINSQGRWRTSETKPFVATFTFLSRVAHAAIDGNLMMRLVGGGVIGGPQRHYHSWLFRHAASL
ncbi:pyruvate, phosphate dikinase regulatory protein 1, chloroplastic-like [Primulina huaijiensis]|uniref:pyruvate, phosphate dikinase regulatory protein 1, chloroplastic-like n=1 Tax=Primulina huaijiensis TaxID=1492673 RepID=UPI003CC77774